MLDDRLRLAVVGVDHDDGRPLVFENADRRLLVPDDGGNCPGQGFDGLEQPNRHYIVEAGVGQCLQQQCGLGGRLVVPRHSDDTQMVIARIRVRVHPQYLLCDLLRGTHGTHALLGVQCRFLMVQDGAVCAVPLSEDPPEGGRRQ